MITAVRLGDYKCFQALDLRFCPLTILTGFNGAGKSSVLQALLLARIANAGRVVRVNDESGLALGTAMELVRAEADEPVVRVNVLQESGEYGVRLRAPDEEATFFTIEESRGTLAGGLGGHGLGFIYLAASRLGPRTHLDLSGEPDEQLGLGPGGEYVAQVLFTHRRVSVREPLLHPTTENEGIVTAGHQLELWLGEIVRPLHVEALRELALMATTLRFRELTVTAETLRPANIGFGVSYVLPIILGALLSPSDGLLIVENPEAHLHPAAQSRLGRFLARVAAAGTQVIVETHSDHFVNGVRRGVGQDRVLAHESLAVHFFGPSSSDPVREIAVDNDGRLSEWPPGFFDQLDEDLAALTRIHHER